jgi:hypothetical protein
VVHFCELNRSQPPEIPQLLQARRAAELSVSGVAAVAHGSARQIVDTDSA